MPSGVYERKPHMRSAGQLAGQHEYVRRLAADGATNTEIARAFGVTRQTIQKVLRAEWNPGRSHGRAA